jgi:hypothetical protein
VKTDQKFSFGIEEDLWGQINQIRPRLLRVMLPPTPSSETYPLVLLDAPKKSRVLSLGRALNLSFPRSRVLTWVEAS